MTKAKKDRTILKIEATQCTASDQEQLPTDLHSLFESRPTVSKSPPVHLLIPSAVYTSPNFLSPVECKAWVDYAELVCFERLLSPQTSMFAYRECGRISKTSVSMANKLFQRMKYMVDRIVQDVQISKNKSYKAVSCNSNFRIYKYEKGMRFGRHFDESEKISDYDGGNTEITALIIIMHRRVHPILFAKGEKD